MNAVWMVGERKLLSRIRFWAAAVGYDRGDRSLGHRIYLFYVLAFFTIWGFTVLLLLTDLGSGILTFYEGIPPGQAATLITTIILLGDTFIRSFRASKHSPFKFSEDDAGLICQTLVSRRSVALVWMLIDWLPRVLPYLIMVVVLCFAKIQLEESGSIAWSRLPAYWLAGFRAACEFIPVHFALTGFVFAIGATRLRQDKDYPRLYLFPLAMAMTGVILGYIKPEMLQILVWPVYFPLLSGFGEASWPAGLIAGLALSVISLISLICTSSNLNLSRAAQESRYKLDNSQLWPSGGKQLKRQVKPRDRLGTDYRPGRLPANSGVRVVFWKDWVISFRVIRFDQVAAWLGIFISGIGMMVANGWGTRFFAFIIWAILLGLRCTERLRSDLELWVISRQLPFRYGELVLAEIALPVSGVICLSWLAYGVSYWMGNPPMILLAVLTPWVILCVVLAAVGDILRQCKSSELLQGWVAEIGPIGIVVGILTAGIPWLILGGVADQIISRQVYSLMAVFTIFLCLGITYLLWKWSVSLYKKIT